MSSKKFGTFLGVFLPSLLTVLGLIMYLRIGWVIGNLGLAMALLAVLMAHTITFTTGLSASSIATNMDIGAGGEYFLVSRSLGLETGGAIGIAFYISRTLSLTFYCFGFVEVLLIFWPDARWGPIPSYLPQLLTASLIIIVTALAAKSAELVLKIQIPMFILVGLSILALIIGVFSGELHAPQWKPASPLEEGNFWIVFAVLFPGVTGFMSGMSMSGNLKNPARSIPRGIIRAIISSFIIYSLIVVLFSITGAVSKEQLLLPEFGINTWTSVAIFGGLFIFPAVLGAVLSAAITSVLSGPRVLRSLSVDRLVHPFFARSASTGEPTSATWFTGAIALIAVALGDLNTIAKFVTVLFLTLYMVINLVAAIEKLVSEPSFRPTIQVPWQVSMFGAVAALLTIYFISPLAMVFAIGLEVVAYIYFRRKALQQQWGDVYAGFWMRIARFALLRMNYRKISARNWRPLILVFVKNVSDRIELVKLAAAFGQNRGVLSIAQIIKLQDQEAIDNQVQIQNEMKADLKPHGLEAFCEVHIAEELHPGILSISKGHGLAGLKTNTIMFGWSGMRSSNSFQLKIIQDLAKSGKNIVLARFNKRSTANEKRRKEIHLWWGGRESNGDLALIFAYMLKLNLDWEKAKIKIKAALHTPDEKEALEKIIHQSIERSRIPAEVEVHLKNGRGFKEILKEKSNTADILFLGLKQTSVGEEEQHVEELEEMGETARIVVFVQNNSHRDSMPSLLR